MKKHYIEESKTPQFTEGNQRDHVSVRKSSKNSPKKETDNRKSFKGLIAVTKAKLQDKISSNESDKTGNSRGGVNPVSYESDS